MDKIKPYLALLKKHHFWPLAVIVMATSAYAWYSGTAAFDAAFTANRGQIQSTFSTIQQVASSSNPPNASYAEDLGKLRKQQGESTLAAWSALYDRQKGLFTWPDFAKGLASAKPPTAAAEGDDGSGAAPAQTYDDERENYLNSFSKYFNELFKIVQPLELKAAPVANATGPAPAVQPGGGSGKFGGQRRPVGQSPAQGAAARTEEMTGIVDWPAAEREAILKKYQWTKTPTLEQVRIAQEDYWLYKAVFEIIAKANESAGAKDRYTAAIKRIKTLALAQAALAAPQSSLEAIPREALQPVDQGAIPKPPGPDTPDAELLTGRYVDAQGIPAAGDPNAGEYKLVPLWMVFDMDQRAIPNLLAACANSPLTVEVKQVILNPQGGGGGGGPSAPAGGKFGMSGGGGIPAAAAPVGGGRAAPVDGDLNHCTVDVRGVMYVFNPPNKQTLGLEEPPAEGEAAATADGEAAGTEIPETTEPAAETPAATNEAQPPAEQPATPADQPPTDGQPQPEGQAPAEGAPPAAGEPAPSADAAPAEPAAAPATPE